MNVSVEHEALTSYCVDLRNRYALNREVLLIQIPQSILTSFDPRVAKKRGYYAFPPTGLQSLAQSLEGLGLDLSILDLNLALLRGVIEEDADPQAWLEYLADYLETHSPSVIGIGCMFEAGIRPLMDILQFLRHRDEAVLLTGGVIASYEWRNLLGNDLCHFVVRGEGENRIRYILDNLLAMELGEPSVDGIYFAPGEAALESKASHQPTPPDPYRGNLVSTYELVPIEDYHRFGSLNPFSRIAGIHRSPYAAIGLNRGCRATCTFCAVPDFMGRGVRSRGAAEVLREMEFLIHERGVRHFEWLDDDLLYKKERLIEVLETIIAQQWPITWSANNGLIAAAIDRQTLGLMRDSGCIGFKVGIETGNAEMLRRVRKPGTLDAFRRFSALMNECPEIFVGANFIIGLPGETFGQMLDSYHFYREIQLDWAAFSVCQFFRGASAFSDFEDYFAEQMTSGGRLVENLVPTRDSRTGKIEGNSEQVLQGMEIFALDRDSIPSKAQIREIWFTFNLLSNFIHNKNLRPGGRIEKFLSWVEMAQCAYPANAYMSLFLGLGQAVAGELESAREHYQRTESLIQDPYWAARFAAFGLDRLVGQCPTTGPQVALALEETAEALGQDGR